MRPRAGVRAGALASSWPCAGLRPLARPQRAPTMVGEDAFSTRRSRRMASSSPALPADAEGAPLLQAYTTDRTPDSAPKLVASADVDSHRSLR